MQKGLRRETNADALYCPVNPHNKSPTEPLIPPFWDLWIHIIPVPAQFSLVWLPLSQVDECCIAYANDIAPRYETKPSLVCRIIIDQFYVLFNLNKSIYSILC